MSYPRFSIIIPVYNRPDELDELLHSLVHQTSHNFEVIIVEDGSSLPCGKKFEKHQKSLPISYHFKENTGPGPTRNHGAKFAIGTYLIFFDSDCIIPQGFFEILDKALLGNGVDFFGGPDCAHPSFTPIQKAISYCMTSFFTTGGIRGRTKKLDRFYPRSFNMGIKREVFEQIGGFKSIRFGEDIDLSIRLLKNGFKGELIEDAWVYHKRRADFRKFYRQVFNSGVARYNLELKYPGTIKLVHYLPSLFVLFCLFALITLYFIPLIILVPFLFSLIIFIDSWIENKNLNVAILSVAAAFVQLTGYGLGVINAFWKRKVLGNGEFISFEKTFYK
jgi:glycosyltransferase involved in cell wall biosynthesis